MLCDLVAGGLGLLLASIPAAALAAPGAQAPAVRTTFDPGSWRADLDRIREALTSDYANPEWLLTERELDLVAPSCRTILFGRFLNRGNLLF